MRVLTHMECGKAAMVVGAKLLALTQEPDCERLYNLGRPLNLYAVPRGGVPAAYLIAGILDCNFVDTPEEADVIVDDLIDSGSTLEALALINPGAAWAVLFAKPNYPGVYENSHLFCWGAKAEADDWLVFPWEGTLDRPADSAADIGTRLLQFIGEDPQREGLKDTPARFARAWQEWTQGYRVDTAALFKDFGDGAEGYDEMIIVDPIAFYSHCEHHLAAIFGTVHIAYIPNGRIAGLSKFCRLVDAFAQRLQVQERLTVQIVEGIVEALAPIGVGVIVRARHFCMESRGAKKPGTETTTIAIRGAMKTEPATRAEFLALVKGRS